MRGRAAVRVAEAEFTHVSERRDGAVFVCPLSAVPDTVRRCNARHLVTLLQGDVAVTTPAEVERHLRLGVDDVTEVLPAVTAPGPGHVRQLIAFAEEWGGQGAMVVHCMAGISRSTAAAFIALCLVNPDVPELAIARALRIASPTAQPNRLIVALADDALGRRGRMLNAVEAMGPAVRGVMGVPFSLRADPQWLSRVV